MRIAFVVPFFPSLSQTFILNQITGLIDRGHDVDIFSKKYPKESISHPDVNKYNLLNNTYYLSCPSNKIVRLKRSMRLISSGIKNKPGVLFKSLNIFRYGKKALSLSVLFKTIPFLKGYDIIQCHFGNTGDIPILLKEIGIGGKYITTFHGTDTRLGIEKGGNIYNKLFEVNDSFIAPTEYNYKHLKYFGLEEDKIIKHPLGINIKKFTISNNSIIRKPVNCIKILTTARLVKEKGLQYAIEGIDKLRSIRREADIEYNIIGDGPLKGELNRLISRKSLQKIVKLHGEQDQKYIIDLLRKSHIFLLPSIAESFGLVLLEAQAAGLPVIATSVGGTHEAIIPTKTGILIAPQDSDAIADNLNELIEKPKKRIKMGLAGKEFVTRHYDIEMLNDGLVKIYQKVMATGRKE